MIKEVGRLAIRGAAFAASAAAVLAGGYILERMGIKDARVISTGAVAAGGLVFAGTMFASHKLTTAFDAWVGIKEYKHNPEEKICRSVENGGPPVIQVSFKDNFAEHYQPARCITAKEAEEKAIHLLLNEEAGNAA